MFLTRRLTEQTKRYGQGKNSIRILRFSPIHLSLFALFCFVLWHSYLASKNLCGRVKVQSFIDAEESQISQTCTGTGWRVEGATVGNLCINITPMDVFDVDSEKEGGKCTVKFVKQRKGPVVVACNMVEGQCLPVHYEKYSNQKKNNISCRNVTTVAWIQSVTGWMMLGKYMLLFNRLLLLLLLLLLV